MRPRYVWLVCATAVVIVEVLRTLALRSRLVPPDALDSLRYVLYLVAGTGGGRLEASGRLRRAVGAGLLAGAITGLVGCIAGRALAWGLGLEPIARTVSPAVQLVVLCGVMVATAATLGALGGILGWGVRRAVEPAA